MTDGLLFCLQGLQFLPLARKHPVPSFCQRIAEPLGHLTREEKRINFSSEGEVWDIVSFSKEQEKKTEKK